MKKETKELVSWLKETLKEWASMTPFDKRNNNSYCKSLCFLDSLPEIESHLCCGGYIQDRNGTPCCHGDAVKYNSEVYGEQVCTLEWDNVRARFFAVYKADQLRDGSVFKLEQQLEFTTDEIEKYEGTL